MARSRSRSHARTRPLLAGAALALAAAAAGAVEVRYTAELSGLNEVPANAGTASGSATLLYDTKDTASTADDTYDFVLAATGLTGTATAYHIHAPAPAGQNAAVRIGLDAFPFATLVNAGGALSVTGDDVAVPPLIPSQNGFPAMPFLEVLQMGLAYVNVHSARFPGGEIRGQLVVTPVPEPETWALLAAGLGALGWVGRRRAAAAAGHMPLKSPA